MSSLALSRIGSFTNSATTYVVLAASNKLKPKPMIAMPSDDHAHHDHDEHINLPNKFQPMSTNSLTKLNIRGNLKVTNAFTSNCYFLLEN